MFGCVTEFKTLVLVFDNRIISKITPITCHVLDVAYIKRAV